MTQTPFPQHEQIGCDPDNTTHNLGLEFVEFTNHYQIFTST